MIILSSGIDSPSSASVLHTESPLSVRERVKLISADGKDTGLSRRERSRDSDRDRRSARRSSGRSPYRRRQRDGSPETVSKRATWDGVSRQVSRCSLWEGRGRGRRDMTGRSLISFVGVGALL